MKRCPITYELINDDEHYSKRGLHLLSPRLENLLPLPLSAEAQRLEARWRVGKMSIQGVQTKLSAVLKIKEQCFEIVDTKGNFILKTQSAHYPELPENEALTMTLAATLGLAVPVHGLIYAADNSMTYFIKRFDRQGRHEKLAVEDFAQLLGLERDTKYRSSMEKVAEVISQYCTYPKVEYVKLFTLTVFNFLIGNEDMHLKNFSLRTNNKIISLSPVYDLVNTSIAMGHYSEELALPVKGKKNNITFNVLMNYYGKERLGLNDKTITSIMNMIQDKLPSWSALIHHSFLSASMKKAYLDLLKTRAGRLGLSFNEGDVAH